MAALLVATGVFLYLRFESELDTSVDQGLRSRADEVAALIGDASALREARPTRLVEQDETFTQVLGPRGEVIDATPGVGHRQVLSHAQLELASRGPILTDRAPLAGGLEGGLRVLARPARDERVVVVGASLEDRDEALASLVGLLATGGPLALVLTSLAGYGLASAALRPVEAMRRRATEISQLEDGRRLPVPAGRDELARLGETLNGMLARLERSLERERGFVASASHELRTPLALLKSELELALRDGRSQQELRAALASAAEETDRLIALAEDLLVLARADEGRLPVRPATLAAEELLHAVGRRFARRIAASGRELSVDAPSGLALKADRLRAEQALGNLLDNALHHGDGAIRLAAKARGDRVRLHVRDDGPGLAPELLASAFERFARGDRARGRGGTGLGLAIVDAIARAHGGCAGAESGDHGGADVWIELPLCGPDAAGGEAGSHRHLIRGG